MQIISLSLLFWLHSIAVQGFIELFSPVIGLPYSPYYLSLLLTLLGISLGLIVYVLSNLHRAYRRLIVTGVLGFILILITISILFVGFIVLYELIINLTKFALGLTMCTVAVVGSYGIVKRQQTAVIASGGGILFFFFFTRILLGDFVSIVQPIEVLILFFVLFICFLELAVKAIYFNSSIEKITKKETDGIILKRFNTVFNRYLIFISFVLIICYGVSLIILQHDNPLISITAGEIINMDLKSIPGMWFLTIMMAICTLIFWFLIPREKTKTKQF